MRGGEDFVLCVCVIRLAFDVQLQYQCIVIMWEPGTAPKVTTFVWLGVSELGLPNLHHSVESVSVYYEQAVCVVSIEQ